MGVFIKLGNGVLNFTLSNNTWDNFRYKGGSYYYKTNMDIHGEDLVSL